MVNTSAYIIVFLQPNLSNIKPQIILPNPLQTDNTPTIVTAKVAVNLLAMDISLGCSGWVYGLNVASSVLAGHGMKRALLLCGDARKRAKCDFDPLFGFAGTVTALEYTGNVEDMMRFHLGTDGSGYDALIIPDGGSRNPASADSFVLEEFDGKMMHRMQTRMKGMDVFSFAISYSLTDSSGDTSISSFERPLRIIELPLTLTAAVFLLI